MLFQWDESIGMLVDQMGLPVPAIAVQELQEQCAEHLKKTPEHRELVVRKLIEEKFPSMVGQVDYEAWV